MTEVIREVALEMDVPYLSARAILERHLGSAMKIPFELKDHTGTEIRVQFKGIRDPVLIVTNLSQEPRGFHPLPLRDDGVGGDLKAKDGVWTLAIPSVAIQGTVEFTVFASSTLERYGLPVNNRIFRTLTLREGQGFDGGTWTSEEWTAGIADLMIPGDFIHPSVEGHRLIAEALAAMIAPHVASKAE